MRIAPLALAALLLAPAADAQLKAGNQEDSMTTSAGDISINDVVGGLDHPWGMAFLPDGRLLVTERDAGTLRVVNRDGTLSGPVGGTPFVSTNGQGGMLDVALDPDFASNSYVYLTYAEPGEAGTSTALGRGRMQGDSLAGFEVVFRMEPKMESSKHYGSRIAFLPDGTLALTTGERFEFDPAQDLSNHLGKVIRINPDGSVPADNPFVNQAGAMPEIWSYGHRNVQAAAVDPATGNLWVVEMGPLGGDELNLVQKGANYGWPIVSWGKNYDGSEIPDPPTRPEFTDAVKHWTPVISPNGMMFYGGSAFPAWQGSAFVGSLSRLALMRLTIMGDQVVGEEQLDLGARIRDVEEGPDGLLYVLTDADDGHVWRIAPLSYEGDQ
jgi:glucose/arabinose dehydrogenase